MLTWFYEVVMNVCIFCLMNRSKVSGPGGTSYWVSHAHGHETAHGGGSDADEV